MAPLKFLIPFVLISLVGHALVLALTTGAGWRGILQPLPKPEQILTVSLEGGAERPARSSARKPRLPSDAGAVGLAREDSVSMQKAGSPYSGYIQVLRRKIEDRWLYPPQALAERQEGDTQIYFTIEANGTLSNVGIIASSGSPSLDAGTLAVVRAAAPYDPLPAAFKLARLHITATFSYRMEAEEDQP